MSSLFIWLILYISRVRVACCVEIVVVVFCLFVCCCLWYCLFFHFLYVFSFFLCSWLWTKLKKKRWDNNVILLLTPGVIAHLEALFIYILLPLFLSFNFFVIDDLYQKMYALALLYEINTIDRNNKWIQKS